MNAAVAHSTSPRHLGAARQRRVAVVVDASCREAIATRLASALAQGTGIVALRGVAGLVDDRPDAVVLAADFGVSNGMAAVRRIRREVPAVPLVVVAHDDRSGFVARQVLNAGADAVVLADAMDQALTPALDAVMAGLVCAPRAARRLVAKPTFAHREKEVLELLVTGLTNRQIAARLYLAESTVKNHLASAFAKLGVHSRKDAVALLLDPAEGLAATALPPR